MKKLIIVCEEKCRQYGDYLALGMSPMPAMINVILPQAFKNIIPEMANTFLTN